MIFEETELYYQWSFYYNIKSHNIDKNIEFYYNIDIE